MPIFEYRCSDCKAIFDRLVSFSESGRSEGPLCPECGTEDAERVEVPQRSAPAVHYRGDWFCTKNRSY